MTLLNTLPEPKKSILQSIRNDLVALGYGEDAGYDAINIESYLSYSVKERNRFFLKHKWEVLALLVLYSESERQAVLAKFPSLSGKEINTEEIGFAMKFDPEEEKESLIELAKFFLEQESGPK